MTEGVGVKRCSLCEVDELCGYCRVDVLNVERELSAKLAEIVRLIDCVRLKTVAVAQGVGSVSTLVSAVGWLDEAKALVRVVEKEVRGS